MSMRSARGAWLLVLFGAMNGLSLPLASFPFRDPGPENVQAWVQWAALVQWSPADPYYRSAERCYQVGDFEKAVRLCEQGLQSDSTHGPSKALRTEVQFILSLGQGPPRLSRLDVSRRLDLCVWYGQRGLSSLAEDQVLSALKLVNGCPEGQNFAVERERAYSLLSWIEAERRKANNQTED